MAEEIMIHMCYK